MASYFDGLGCSANIEIGKADLASILTLAKVK